MKLFQHIGKYSILTSSVFSKPERFTILWKRFVTECVNLGVSSIGIVALMSLFMGAAIALQTAANISSPLIPDYTIGFTVRESLIKEFCPTIISLVLAGKVGSNISSEIGTMRVSEQIDALEIMGVNSASYLILPKILASVFMFPFIIIISMFLGLIGGAVVVLVGAATTYKYELGIQYWFETDSIVYALTKTAVFAYIITSVSSYFGYYVKGGSLEVGKSSTRAVVYSSTLILIFNYLITQWWLS